MVQGGEYLARRNNGSESLENLAKRDALLAGTYLRPSLLRPKRGIPNVAGGSR